VIGPAKARRRIAAHILDCHVDFLKSALSIPDGTSAARPFTDTAGVAASGL
jgi:hypothetical protein